MRHYKIVSYGHILSIGIGAAGEEITEQEYTQIRSTIKNAPTAPDGYVCMLTESLEWELVSVKTPEIDEDATADDYRAALSEMGVQV